MLNDWQKLVADLLGRLPLTHKVPLRKLEKGAPCRLPPLCHDDFLTTKRLWETLWHLVKAGPMQSTSGVSS